MQLVTPNHSHIPSYCAALTTGWSPNNLRRAAAYEQLAAIDQDVDGFLAGLQDPLGLGGDVKLPDGSHVKRLPSLRRWMWLDGFCGSIGLRWSPGTNDLPKTASGHIGYAVVPWMRRKGMATEALRQMLPLAQSVGLTLVDLTIDPDNLASIKVARKAGAKLVTRYEKHPSLGRGDELLFRIDLAKSVTSTKALLARGGTL